MERLPGSRATFDLDLPRPAIDRIVVAGDGLSFGPIASTRRMCASGMEQEDAFLQALENAQRYSISGEDLTIENAGGEVTMRFVAVYMP